MGEPLSGQHSIDALVVRNVLIEAQQHHIAALTAERDRYQAALVEIRTNYGKVCGQYELCEHVACQSSYGAWATADEALAGYPLAGVAQEGAA